ncbi:nuclear transport factor 2 family protein [Streptosporangium sp. NBC_01495]|uniref:nuclear transport factor 2 family protein n=1 Tax=Streptosporangium sp. NBC_01495 TaxID=2903899 RepID=UPI002E3565A6|nr:nuclear transport factor 2 family protein [Streptosporangium sp. NBC_01495]
MEDIALMRSVLGPLERGESEDSQPLYDLFAEDIVYRTAHGDELRSKTALLDYFERVTDLLEVRPYDSPLQYFGDGARVVVLGVEHYRVRKSGLTVSREWVWFLDFRDRRISRILEVQELSGIVEIRREAFARTAANFAESTGPAHP